MLTDVEAVRKEDYKRVLEQSRNIITVPVEMGVGCWVWSHPSSCTRGEDAACLMGSSRRLSAVALGALGFLVSSSPPHIGGAVSSPAPLSLLSHLSALSNPPIKRPKNTQNASTSRASSSHSRWSLQQLLDNVTLFLKNGKNTGRARNPPPRTRYTVSQLSSNVSKLHDYLNHTTAFRLAPA